MLGDDNQTWDLHIKNVEISDEGLYQCQVLASSKSPPMRSEYATLEVTSRPDPPVLTSGPRLLVKPDSSALVQCISKGQRSKWDKDKGNKKLIGKHTGFGGILSYTRIGNIEHMNIFAICIHA